VGPAFHCVESSPPLTSRFASPLFAHGWRCAQILVFFFVSRKAFFPFLPPLPGYVKAPFPPSWAILLFTCQGPLFFFPSLVCGRFFLFLPPGDDDRMSVRGLFLGIRDFCLPFFSCGGHRPHPFFSFPWKGGCCSGADPLPRRPCRLSPFFPLPFSPSFWSVRRPCRGSWVFFFPLRAALFFLLLSFTEYFHLAVGDSPSSGECSSLPFPEVPRFPPELFPPAPGDSFASSVPLFGRLNPAGAPPFFRRNCPPNSATSFL